MVHLPDVDEAGHAFGGASKEYADTVAKLDTDLGRLVNGLQDGHTVFVITADHGHIDTGGHGGWESDVIQVPAVIAGPGIKLAKGTGRSEDVAPTVALLAGIGVPRFAAGSPLERSCAGRTRLRSATSSGSGRRSTPRTWRSSRAMRLVLRSIGTESPEGKRLSIAEIEDARAAVDRNERLPIAALGLLAAVLVLVAIAVASRQAFLAALAGTAAYYVVYNALFFVVHRYQWSLSAFNSEDKIDAWMNGRLLEAAIAALVAAAVAAWVYPLLRERPKGPRGEFLPGWLTLGPATVLVILATLGMQVVVVRLGVGHRRHVASAGLQVGVQVRPRPHPGDRDRLRCGCSHPSLPTSLGGIIRESAEQQPRSNTAWRSRTCASTSL